MTTRTEHLALTYLLPLKASAPRSELADYLRQVTRWVAQVVVVDGSPAEIAAAHGRA